MQAASPTASPWEAQAPSPIVSLVPPTHSAWETVPSNKKKTIFKQPLEAPLTPAQITFKTCLHLNGFRDVSFCGINRSKAPVECTSKYGPSCGTGFCFVPGMTWHGDGEDSAIALTTISLMGVIAKVMNNIFCVLSMGMCVSGVDISY